MSLANQLAASCLNFTMLSEQITRFTKSETIGIVTELRSTCVKLGCRVKN